MNWKYVSAQGLILLVLFVMTASATVRGNGAGGDVTEALIATMAMRTPVENGSLSDTEQTGSQAIERTEKAVNSEKDADRKEKLKSVVSLLKEVVSYARQGAWPYADSSLKRALKILDELNG